MKRTLHLEGTLDAEHEASALGTAVAVRSYPPIRGAGELAKLLAAELDGPAQAISENATFVSDVIEHLRPLVARLADESPASPGSTLPGGQTLGAADLAYISGELGPATRCIVEGARAIAEVIGSLSMLDSAPARHETTDLNLLVERAARTVRGRHPESCEFLFELGPIPSVVCDADLLAGTLVELLDSLCERLASASPDTVRMRLVSSVGPENACISVHIQSLVSARALAGFERAPSFAAVRRAIVDGHCGIVRLQTSDSQTAAVFLHVPLNAAAARAEAA